VLSAPPHGPSTHGATRSKGIGWDISRVFGAPAASRAFSASRRAFHACRDVIQKDQVRNKTTSSKGHVLRQHAWPNVRRPLHQICSRLSEIISGLAHSALVADGPTSGWAKRKPCAWPAGQDRQAGTTGRFIGWQQPASANAVQGGRGAHGFVQLLTAKYNVCVPALQQTLFRDETCHRPFPSSTGLCRRLLTGADHKTVRWFLVLAEVFFRSPGGLLIPPVKGDIQYLSVDLGRVNSQ